MAKYQFSAGVVEQQIQALMNEHPDMMLDEDLKEDMLLGSTDFYELVGKIHLNIMYNAALMHSLIDILDDINRRREVLKNRVDFQRALIKRLMEVAEQPGSTERGQRKGVGGRRARQGPWCRPERVSRPTVRHSCRRVRRLG